MAVLVTEKRKQLHEIFEFLALVSLYPMYKVYQALPGGSSERAFIGLFMATTLVVDGYLWLTRPA